MKKRTRRLVALLILTTLISPLSVVIKMVIVSPLIVLLLLEWDQWSYERRYENERKTI